MKTVTTPSRLISSLTPFESAVAKFGDGGLFDGYRKTLFTAVFEEPLNIQGSGLDIADLAAAGTEMVTI
ncbi:hypothetical protein MASR1M12_37530 [Erysipelotrichia bacterium]